MLLIYEESSRWHLVAYLSNNLLVHVPTMLFVLTMAMSSSVAYRIHCDDDISCGRACSNRVGKALVIETLQESFQDH